MGVSLELTSAKGAEQSHLQTYAIFSLLRKVSYSFAEMKKEKKKQDEVCEPATREDEIEEPLEFALDDNGTRREL